VGLLGITGLMGVMDRGAVVMQVCKGAKVGIYKGAIVTYNSISIKYLTTIKHQQIDCPMDSTGHRTTPSQTISSNTFKLTTTSITNNKGTILMTRPVKTTTNRRIDSK
jgi:hypothetical protein